MIGLGSNERSEADMDRMKTLLVADPPAGDKVAAMLKPYCDVLYTRGAHEKTMRVPAGTHFVVAMNLRNAGGRIREEAERVGARFVQIPPSWSRAQGDLLAAGFFALAEKHGAPAFTPEPAPAAPTPSADGNGAVAATGVTIPAAPSAIPPSAPPEEAAMERLLPDLTTEAIQNLCAAIRADDLEGSIVLTAGEGKVTVEWSAAVRKVVTGVFVFEDK
jgi:hypothetical protein